MLLNLKEVKILCKNTLLKIFSVFRVLKSDKKTFQILLKMHYEFLQSVCPLLSTYAHCPSQVPRTFTPTPGELRLFALIHKAVIRKISNRITEGSPSVSSKPVTHTIPLIVLHCSDLLWGIFYTPMNFLCSYKIVKNYHHPKRVLQKINDLYMIQFNSKTWSTTLIAAHDRGQS